MRTRRYVTTLTTALALATGGFMAAGAEATDPGTGPDHVIWAKTTGANATDLLSGVQVGSYRGDNLQSTNVARADSTDCTDCRTVAVAVQAVLLKHNPATAEPKNVAIALNERCERCTTYAYAYQYVVTTEHRAVLTRRARRKVAALRWEIDEVSRSDLSPDDLNTRLRELTAEFRAVIDADLARQDEDVEDREFDRDSDRD